MEQLQILSLTLNVLGLALEFFGAFILLSTMKTDEEIEKMSTSCIGPNPYLMQAMLTDRRDTQFSLGFLIMGFSLQMLGICLGIFA